MRPFPFAIYPAAIKKSNSDLVSLLANRTGLTAAFAGGGNLDAARSRFVGTHKRISAMLRGGVLAPITLPDGQVPGGSISKGQHVQMQGGAAHQAGMVNINGRSVVIIRHVIQTPKGPQEIRLPFWNSTGTSGNNLGGGSWNYFPAIADHPWGVGNSWFAKMGDDSAASDRVGHVANSYGSPVVHFYKHFLDQYFGDTRHMQRLLPTVGSAAGNYDEKSIIDQINSTSMSELSPDETRARGGAIAMDELGRAGENIYSTPLGKHFTKLKNFTGNFAGTGLLSNHTNAARRIVHPKNLGKISVGEDSAPHEEWHSQIKSLATDAAEKLSRDIQ